MASQISTLQSTVAGKADAGTEITGGAFSNNTLTLTKQGGGSVDINFPEISSGTITKLKGYVFPESYSGNSYSFRCTYGEVVGYEDDFIAIGNIAVATQGFTINFLDGEYATSIKFCDMTMQTLIDIGNGMELYNLPDGTYSIGICPVEEGDIRTTVCFPNFGSARYTIEDNTIIHAQGRIFGNNVSANSTLIVTFIHG